MPIITASTAPATGNGTRHGTASVSGTGVNSTAMTRPTTREATTSAAAATRGARSLGASGPASGSCGSGRTPVKTPTRRARSARRARPADHGQTLRQQRRIGTATSRSAVVDVAPMPRWDDDHEEHAVFNRGDQVGDVLSNAASVAGAPAQVLDPTKDDQPIGRPGTGHARAHGVVSCLRCLAARARTGTAASNADLASSCWSAPSVDEAERVTLDIAAGVWNGAGRRRAACGATPAVTRRSAAGAARTLGSRRGWRSPGAPVRAGPRARARGPR